jgi:formate hydrogenlyase subunit 3/multisubunit Na+/H+ antiporter MnhD subunit
MVFPALACAAVLIATAPLAVMVRNAARARYIVYGICLIASLALLAIALLALLGIFDSPSAATLALGIPWLGAHFRLDALSAFFLAVVNLGAAAASLFALGYARHEHAPRRVLPFFPAFLAGMNIVVLADDAFTFLVAWEFMSLSSWALVMAHHRVADNVRAGYVYLIMASFGTLALLLTFGLLAGPDGGYAFGDIRDAHPSATLAASILILALIGAGSKAGLVPLHVWLPLAHPAAPSHVSALMSGVMTKVAVYGFVRIVFDLAGTPAWWWSMVVLALGGVTAVMGVLYALMQQTSSGCSRITRWRTSGSFSSGLALRSPSRRTEWPGRRRSRSRPACCMCSIIRSSKAFCSLVQARCSQPPGSATWTTSVGSSIACRRPLSFFSSAARRSRRCRRSTVSSPNG